MLRLIRKRISIDPLVQGKDWDALLEEGLVAGWFFDSLLEDISEEGAAIHAAAPKSIRDMVAHVADVNYGVANILEAFTRGRSLQYEASSLNRGAERRPFSEVRADHANSLLRMAESTGRPLNPNQVSWHFEYGRLNGKEWLATIVTHYRYHTRQLERIKSSGAYKAAGRATRPPKEQVG
ncbi:MAG: hypothetical protein JWL77_6671 [Chthonomonadaceae bacterium]|jgi:hypothetical protein|nr:hypothetical protein [Chthonomonadaceae bacterium]